MASSNKPEYEPRKMFIGGLSWDTTEDTMKKYFSQYGEVEACQTMSLKDENGLVIKPRGFGFVTFRDDESVDSVGNTKEHILDGKTIDPKRANTKAPGPQQCHKVFIGGLSFNTAETTIRDAFIENGLPPKLDGQTMKACVEIKKEGGDDGRSRGFGFVEFDSADMVDKATKLHYVTIDDKRVEIKKAEVRKNGGGMGGNVNNSAMMAYAGVTSYPSYLSSDNGRYTSVGSTPQYGTNGGGYHPHYQQQYNNSSYAGYDQHGNTAQVYQNYNTGYTSRGYSSAQQQHLQQQQHMSTSYGQGQPTNYSQSRAFNSGTESYQTSGGSNFSSYDPSYGYSTDQTGSTTAAAYSRMSGSSNSTGGQTRGGTSGFHQSYGGH